MQQLSSLRCSSPGSHSSPSSTLEFPHTLLFLSLKQVEALDLSRFAMEILLQFENIYREARKKIVTNDNEVNSKHGHMTEERTLLLEWSPLTAMGYITYLPPWSSLGAQWGMSSGSCTAPKLWPSSWVVTRSASCVSKWSANQLLTFKWSCCDLVRNSLFINSNSGEE